MPEGIDRRNFCIYGLPALVLLASAQEMRGLNELRSYAVQLWQDTQKRYNDRIRENPGTKEQEPETVVYDDYLNGRRIKLEVTSVQNSLGFEMTAFNSRNKRVGQHFDFDENHQSLEKRIVDFGVKGDLSGTEDYVEERIRTRDFVEEASWYADGGYIVNIDQISPQVSIYGTAIYTPRYTKTADAVPNKPFLIGIYENGHNKLETRRKEALRYSVKQYQNLLARIIMVLEKEGKIIIR